MPSRALALALAVFALAACSRPIEADLLDVREATPTRLQPGHRLALIGSGFPAGREARVTLRGQLQRPGLPPRALDVTLAGEAVAADRVEVPLPASALRTLGGRGTFRGAIRVAFGADALDRGEVVGTQREVEIDFVSREAPLESSEPSLASRIGLELAPREDDGIGLVVERVARGSRAHDAGLEGGDRILTAAGVNLLAAHELAAPTGSGALDLRVMREGEPAPFLVRVSLEGLDSRVDRAAVRWAQLAAFVLIVALLLLGPGSSWVDRLAPASRQVPWLLAGAAFAGALGLHAALDALPALGLDAALLAIASGRGAAIVLGASGLRARTTAAMRALAGALAIAVALGVATLAIGTTDPAAIEAAQGPWPWDWTGLRSPVGPVAIVLVALAAACGPVLEGASDRRRALDDVFLVALAACAVIGLAGGQSAERAISDVRPALGWMGTASYGALVALVTILLRRARERGARAATPILVLAVALIASLATAVALSWIELEVPREIERAIAEVLVAGALLAVARLATARAPQPVRAHHALL